MTGNRVCAVVVCLAAASGTVGAPAPQSPQELLAEVRATLASEDIERSAREARFAATDQQRAKALAKAREALAGARQEVAGLRAAFAANQEKLAKLREQLAAHSGGVGDLRTQFQQTAGDTQALFKDSLISSQLANRTGKLKELLQVDTIPTPKVLRELWVMLQEEMTETGRIAQFRALVASPDGNATEALVTRVGGFSAVVGDRFLRYLPEFGTLEAIEPQPSAAQRNIAAAYTEAPRETMQPMIIDPTRGAVLGLLAKVPGLWERILQGRVIGFVIIGIGVLGLVLAVERLVVLLLEQRRMHRQQVSVTPDRRNALGRVMLAYQEHRHLPAEALELKLDEAVLQNTPRLQRGLGAIRLFAVITPMLGLLGTVTGLIETFHSITLFGAGDARLMAGGISQALVTTALGLSTAIPLLLLHSLLSMKSRRLLAVLEEQSTGIIAQHEWPRRETRRAA